ncbi:N-acetylglucosaminyltransferase, MurG [Teredinibacter turnerae T7901]|uniref:N-acetylglucosaminyltransferase, MurG n=1 Tax=Teredinibacter turnerae (strain ATCC 39867 / T7901) TaxID=377629 RepID=C5BP59_TERTT|nr:N-acetylglucosaminyltransferase, MurG [Teredinibacter turnerae T7901]
MRAPSALIFSVGLAAAIVVLSGCGASVVVKETPLPPSESVPVARTAKQVLVENLLVQAEQAFRKGHLTEPAHNNAYDRFQSVLLLDPANSEARAGLQAMVIQFAEGVRQALARSRTREAGVLLREAEAYFPEHQLLADLRREMEQMNRALPAESAVRTTSIKRIGKIDAIDEYPLSTAVLSGQRDSLLPLLATLAQRVAQTNESVMIYARTDAEGRWLYKQMKKAAQGYRIRGDIRLSKSPKIAILPPL